MRRAPPHMPDTSPEELLAASLARLAAAGHDAEEVAHRARANLAYWRAHPARWDDGGAGGQDAA